MGFFVFILFVAVIALLVRVLTLSGTVRELQQRVQWVEAHAMQPASPPAATAPSSAVVVEPEPSPYDDHAPEPLPEPQSQSQPDPEPVPAAMQPAPWMQPDAARPAQRERPERQPSRFGAFLAEHALALAGGAFVLIAAILFLTYAINAGWINETLRTVLAGVLAAGLALAAATVARGLDETERIGRAFGSLHGVLAGVAAAVAAADIVVAARRYEILDTTVAFLALLLVGGATLAAAVRWRSQDLGGIGMLGMLAAPIFVDAPADLGTLALLATALVICMATVAIVDWPRLALLATVITGPQVASWAGDSDPARDLAALLVVTFAWWLVIGAAVVVPTLLEPRRARRTSVIGTVVATSFAAYGIFELWLDADGTEASRAAVVGSFAALHVAIGLWLLTRRRAELVGLASTIVSTGAALAAIALFDSLGDSARAAALVAEAVGVSALWWIARSRIAAISAVVLAALAVTQVLDGMLDPDLVWIVRPGWDTLFAPAALLVGLAVAHRLTRLEPDAALITPPLEPHQRDEQERRDGGASFVRRSLSAAGWMTTWYLGFVVVIQLLTPERVGDAPTVGVLTLAAWTFALALVLLDRATRTGREEQFALVGLAGVLIAPAVLADRLTQESTSVLLLATATSVLVLAIVRGTAHAAWPTAFAWITALATVSLAAGDASPERVLGIGVGDALHTLPMLTWLAALFAAAAARLHYGALVRTNALRIAAVLGVYLVSAIVVRAFTDPPGTVQQDAQVALSITWALLGLALLAAGIAGPAWLRALTSLRVGAYVLLGVSAAKVLVLDTSQLETPFRIAVFLAVGLLLLGGARLEQVLRARAAD